jgi:hypothetical protein
MKPFQDKRSVWWIGGVAAALVALFVAFVVVPATRPEKGQQGPRIDVPRMENVPPPSAPPMKLDTER